jgi:hypothetical protein
VKKCERYFGSEDKCFRSVGLIERFPIQRWLVERKRVPHRAVVLEILFFVKLYLKRKIIDSEKKSNELRECKFHVREEILMKEYKCIFTEKRTRKMDKLKQKT